MLIMLLLFMFIKMYENGKVLQYFAYKSFLNIII